MDMTKPTRTIAYHKGQQTKRDRLDFFWHGRTADRISAGMAPRHRARHRAMFLYRVIA